VDLLLEPLAHGFMRRALLAGVLLAGVASLLGVFVVRRGYALLADGLAHATFGGIALGLFLGASSDRAIWAALPFTTGVAVAIDTVRRKSRLSGDVATGIFFTVSLAFGILLLGLRSPQAEPVNVEALLFGSILAVSAEVLLAVGTVTALALAGLVVYGRRLAYVFFDPELAALAGVPVAALESLLLCLVALVVVVGVKTVGVVLVSAFVVIPAATASLVGRSFGAVATFALLFGVGGTVLGLLASYHLDVASGATVILTLASGFFLTLLRRR
jgi:zinc transport system permease protein